MTLSKIYLDYLWTMANTFKFSCSSAEIAQWVQRKYKYERPQARAIGRILKGWLMAGYVPANNLRKS
jgi:hypothetical protein